MSDMTVPVETPFERTCDWSGETGPGKHYVLTTTEGQELVSEDALRAAPADTAAQLDYLTKGISALRREISSLKGNGPKPAAAKARVPGPRQASD